MTAPSRETREVIRKRAEFWATRDPSTIGHLYNFHAVEFAKELVDALDALDAAEERLAAVRTLANGWANQPTDYDEDTEQQIEDGRMLLAVLDGRKRDHWEDS